jgi:hypothetical protein
MSAIAVPDDARAIDADLATPESTPAPDPTPTNTRTPSRGALLLDQVRAGLDQFALLPSPYIADALACWIGHSHMRDHAGKLVGQTTPRLLVLSDVHGAGKSTMFMLAQMMSGNGKMSTDPSSWAIVRDIAERNRSVFIDQFDTLVGRGSGPRTMRNILLSGAYRYSATVSRGREDETELECFAPMAMCGRGRKMRVNDELNALFERSLVVEMEKARPDQVVTEFDIEDPQHAGRMLALSSSLARWGRTVAAEYARMRPELPEGCVNRHRDVWRPLVRVADLAGGDWPERIRKACRAIARGQVDDADTDPMAMLSPAERTLAEVRSVFDVLGETSLATVDLLGFLELLPGSRWSTDPTRIHGCAKVLANDLKTVAASQGLELDRGSCKVPASDGTGRFVAGYQRREVDRITPSGLPDFRIDAPSRLSADDDPPLF